MLRSSSIFEFVLQSLSGNTLLRACQTTSATCSYCGLLQQQTAAPEMLNTYDPKHDRKGVVTKPKSSASLNCVLTRPEAPRAPGWGGVGWGGLDPAPGGGVQGVLKLKQLQH